MNFVERFSNLPLFNIGFRPFFFLAGLSSVIFMFLWSVILQGGSVHLQSMSPQIWHAHEMVFAYLMAVIVGFLLTAVQNWTNTKTINGAALLLLVSLWLIARLLPFIEGGNLWLQGLVDVSFLLFAAIVITIPVVKTKSWKQMGVVTKIYLMWLAHIVFYLGLLGILDDGVRWGLYGAFYMLLSLTFTIARRVMPFFTKNGLGLNVDLKNHVFIDRASLVLIVLYVTFELFYPTPFIHLIAALLFVLHSVRLAYWYQAGIWKKPLLWSLYMAYAFLTIGFLLEAVSFFAVISPFVITHSFLIGISFFTLSMMSRVSLGHTGRSIAEPPKTLFYMFSAFILVFIFRVLLPIFIPEQYGLWLIVSQTLWVFIFLTFVMTYSSILLSRRADGKAG